MRRLLVMLFAMVLSVTLARAQKTCVIANAEDHVPIREALIHTNNNHWARTDYRGYWTMKYQFDSATVSKTGFLKTTIYLKNLPDTVFLLPESKQLGTVEVWGKNQRHIKDMEEQVRSSAANTPQQGGASFDLANMLDRRGRRDHKHLKNAKKVLGEMDRKDPIVSAYEQATGKKYELKPTRSVLATGQYSAFKKDEGDESDKNEGQAEKQEPKETENGGQNAEKVEKSTK